MEITFSESISCSTCQVVNVGKQRDGGSRFWCLAHGANATAKYGKPANHCAAAFDLPVLEHEILRLDPFNYPGGVALWGAVPPIYDSTSLPLDRGIHVHARKSSGGDKDIDATFRKVALPVQVDMLSNLWAFVDEVDAINYMVSSVFGFGTKYISCPMCSTSHLDRDWFAVHPHKRHLCHGCGRHFSASELAIGNPVAQLREALGQRASSLTQAQTSIDISQADFLGGIQIWGSNPALIWTSELSEEEGVHIHAYDSNGLLNIDGTFSSVTVDGVTLDPISVRTYMAQRAMPHIESRICSIECSSCHKLHFDMGPHAYTPSADRICTSCGKSLKPSGRLKKVIANPVAAQRQKLASLAGRILREDHLNLRPECI